MSRNPCEDEMDQDNITDDGTVLAKEDGLLMDDYSNRDVS